jgi:hypothetical protein
MSETKLDSGLRIEDRQAIRIRMLKTGLECCAATKPIWFDTTTSIRSADTRSDYPLSAIR